MGNLIFLSHSSKDRDLVDRFVDFLDVTFKIERSDIYCTSLEGTKSIRTGSNFINDIRENIEDTEIVLYFLTPNFLKSQFCLSELGATWALSKRIYPILIPPTSYEDLEGTPLKGVTQFLTMTNEKSLHKMADEFKDMGIIKDINAGLLMAKAISFIKDMPTLYNFEEESTISIEDYNELKKQMNEVIENNNEQDQIIRKLKEEIEQISSLKSVDEIREIRINNLPLWDQFEEHVEGVKDNFVELDYYTISAIYHDQYFSSGLGFWPVRDDWSIIEKLVAEKFLEISEERSEVLPNYDEYLIEKAVSSLKKLDNFLSEEATEEIYVLFREKYQQNIDLTSKRFWEKIFDVRIIMN